MGWLSLGHSGLNAFSRRVLAKPIVVLARQHTSRDMIEPDFRKA